MVSELEEFNIYLLDNARSRAYLQLLLRQNVVPAHRFLLLSLQPLRLRYVLFPVDKDIPDVRGEVESLSTDTLFAVKETVFHTLHKHNLSYTLIRNVDLNSAEIVTLSQTLPGRYTIYCGGK
jgi:hypothetical protein